MKKNLKLKLVALSEENQIYLKLETFLTQCEKKELTKASIKKYKADLIQWLNFSKINNENEITKEALTEYKQYLQDNFKTNTLNIKIVVINHFLSFLELEKLKLKQIKVQRKTTLENVLELSDYERLLRYALKLEKIKIFWIMKVLAGTGIRIGELKYITVEALKDGKAIIDNKGKIRTIVISKNLSKDLLNYCSKEKIKTGIIFKTSSGKLIDKSVIFRQLKYIAGQARVKLVKVHPHSFRHLFAKEFLNKSDNVLLLADLLGHSSLETTRIYSKKSIKEQRDILDQVLNHL